MRAVESSVGEVAVQLDNDDDCWGRGNGFAGSIWYGLVDRSGWLAKYDCIPTTVSCSRFAFSEGLEVEWWPTSKHKT